MNLLSPEKLQRVHKNFIRHICAFHSPSAVIERFVDILEVSPLIDFIRRSHINNRPKILARENVYLLYELAVKRA